MDEDQAIQPVADPRAHPAEIKHGKRRVVVRLGFGFGFGFGLGPGLGFGLAELRKINQREYLVQVDYRGRHSPSAPHRASTSNPGRHELDFYFTLHPEWRT
jgi:hypothetical protein